jgi:hypothetical protein
MKKYIKNILSSIVLFAAISGCEKDFLERYPLDAVSSEDFFKTVNDLKVYIDPFYLSPGYEANTSYRKSGVSELDGNSDIQTDGSSINSRLRGTRTVPASGGEWNWDYEWVRRINYFFENYKRCEDEFDDYKHYLGEAHFFRALTYFQILVEFGDAPWYVYVLGTDSEGLYDPRTPRNIVADNIIADLDSAVMYLSEVRVEGGTRIDKWYALGFQSVVALYEGTWEKYHAGDPFGVSNPDPDKYLNKAVTAAEAVMNSGNFTLYSTGNPETDYYDFFIQRDYSSSKSVLFWHKYSRDLDVFNEFNYIHKYPQDRGLLTKGLADSYLCIDGDPISVSPLFAGYDTITNEMKDRDPRFTQTFFHPDDPWLIDGNTITTWGVGIFKKIHTNNSLKCATSYMYRKSYNPDTEFQAPEDEENPIIRFRYAQVLLNFAEAKAELGVITQADLDRSINLLRDRVGMPHLNLANITTDPDWIFKDLPGIINEIRRERLVELAIEGHRWNDIARWAAADELIVGKRPKGINGYQFPENSKIRTSIPLDNEGFLDPFQEAMPDGWGFDVNRDYLNPIPLNELTLNSNLVQNPGWSQ